MAPKGVKASKVYKRGSKPKIIDWVTRETSRGARDIAVEVSRSAGWRTKKQAARGIENLNSASHQATLPSMDIDETFWTEDPAADEMKRSRNNYIEEFIPRVDSYLHCLLSYEGVPATSMCARCKSAPFEWRCSDCFPAPVLCRECCQDSHQQLPFHRVQKWTGKYFMPSWLQEIGVNLCLGHSGDLCPTQSMDCNEEDRFQADSCDKDDVTADLGFGSSKPFITVIDRSGIHEISINWCCCLEAPKHDLQLMMAGLFPATFHNPKMAFTFWVLEEFHLDNLECKTTPSQFFSRLRRLTNDVFLNTVLIGDRYRELLRISRYWRALTSRKRFGFGYGEINQDKPGSMAIFCALCAQPGINLPEDWREYENRKTLFMRGFMMDGNFQAEHMRMRNPENDVPLSDGTGFMVSQMPYEWHLKLAVDRWQRSTCHDHPAVNNVNKHSGHLESTGIGATACIHGNFVPDSVVDFQKGEAQRNMDYSIFKAINYNTEGIEAALICYDVMCQWSIHMKDRVNDSSFLNLPDNLELKLGNALSMRYRKALLGAIASVAAFEMINASPTPECVATWTAEEMLAQQDQITLYIGPSQYLAPVPSRAEILLELTEKEIGNSGQKGHVAWLANGLKFQEMQLSLQALVRKIGAHPTPDQQRDMTLKRARLQERIDTFQKQAANFIHAAANGEDDSWEDTSAREVYIGSEFDGIDEEDDEEEEGITSPLKPQQMQSTRLVLPKCCQDLVNAELHLRQGQLNDALHHIRISLGYKSYIFRNDVHPACTQRLKTRAWAEVHAAESTVQHHAQVYMRARQAIVDLGATSSLLDRYKVLTRQHLSVKTSIIAPQVREQRNKSLPWFWTMDVRRDADVGEWMEDCKPTSLFTLNQGI
ncbi:hypothetical protein EI94DRAFT_1701133 [Lactarius quietus]|nr:hypothetical protein EI94DRAFT_1701133 [Lactarius quietus]